MDLRSRPDATRPTFTNVQLVTHPKVAAAVMLGVSKPVARATAEKLHGYRILSRPSNLEISASLAGSEMGPEPASTTNGDIDVR